MRWGQAILIGAITAFALLVTFITLGSALKISFADVPFVGTVAYVVITAVVSCGMGGWVSGRLSNAQRREGAIGGLATWAIVVAAIGFFAGQRITEWIGTMSMMGNMGAGSAATLDATVQELSKLKLHVVSDFNLVKGRADSQISAERREPQIAKKSAESVLRDTDDMQLRGKQILGEVFQANEDALVRISWLSVIALILGGLSAAAGGVASAAHAKAPRERRHSVLHPVRT